MTSTLVEMRDSYAGPSTQTETSVWLREISEWARSFQSISPEQGKRSSPLSSTQDRTDGYAQSEHLAQSMERLEATERAGPTELMSGASVASTTRRGTQGAMHATTRGAGGTAGSIWPQKPPVYSDMMDGIALRLGRYDFCVSLENFS